MIEGLDKLQRELDELGKAVAALDGEIGNVSFDPEDPASIDAAIHEMNSLIDAKVGRFSRNDLVAPVIADLKEQARDAILEKAERARAGETDDDDD